MPLARAQLGEHGVGLLGGGGEHDAGRPVARDRGKKRTFALDRAYYLRGRGSFGSGARDDMAGARTDGRSHVGDDALRRLRAGGQHGHAEPRHCFSQAHVGGRELVRVLRAGMRSRDAQQRQRQVGQRAPERLVEQQPWLDHDQQGPASLDAALAGGARGRRNERTERRHVDSWKVCGVLHELGCQR
jgi:hypothetical protein